MPVKKIPVFIFPWYSNPPGNGLHGLTACFVNLGVHVPFTVEMHSENMYFNTVGLPLACDGSCGHGRRGSLHDLSDPKDIYYYISLIEAANNAAKRLFAKRRRVLEPAVKLPARRIREIREAVAAVYMPGKQRLVTRKAEQVLVVGPSVRRKKNTKK